MSIDTGEYINFLKNYEERKKIHIIDAHSHFGKDNFWPNNGDYKKYIKYNNFNIKEVFAMSVPCPVIFEKDGTKKILCYHKEEGKEIKHYHIKEKDGKLIYIPNLLGVNPYKEANDYIYNLCKSESQIKFNYVPLIHPYYYSYDDFMLHIKRGAKMFKIHGVACGVIPNRISENFFKMLEYLKIPIIIHTDFSKEQNLLFYNNAVNWIECLKKYNICVYFAHSVRLSESSIDFINKDDRYVVGIGPDMLLNNNGMNEHDVKDYLKYCFLRFDIDKLVFDFDYPWNIKNINNYCCDWGTIDRIEMLDLSFEEKNKILSKNIKRFLEER